MDTASVLMEALKIYSPPHGEAELAKWLYAFLKSRLDDVWIDEAGNVLAVKGRGAPVVWLHAHMDTVPGPLPVRYENGVVWGRGAVDDKGPLVAYMKAFLEADPRGTLVLALVTAEEDDSAGTQALLQGGPPRPHHIYVGEPTYLHVAYAYRQLPHIQQHRRGAVRPVSRSEEEAKPRGAVRLLHRNAHHRAVRRGAEQDTHEVRRRT
jgi:LysW-gamma-L-lysine carboxypeptidase